MIWLINPITLWLRWIVKKLYYEIKYYSDHITIGYMADVTKCRFGKYNYIYKNSHLYNVTIGDYSYISKNSQVHHAEIGKFSCIGLNVLIGLGKHPSKDFVSIHPLFYSSRGQIGIKFMDKNIFEEYQKVFIGNDVWVGANALINDGVTIGDGAIIAAGSVVTKDVPPYAIVGGVPAKYIRNRFSNEEIDFLKEFKWWNKDIKWLNKHKDHFRNINYLQQEFDK